jgi:membrane-bound lytic murein transglycosylase B
MPHGLFYKTLWLSIGLILNACSQPEQKPVSLQGSTPVNKNSPQTKTPIGPYSASSLTGDYSNYPSLNTFIDQMVAQEGFKRDYLLGLFTQAKRKDWTLNYLAKSDSTLHGKPAKGGWTKYRAQFLDDTHINAGVNFWKSHHTSLEKARKEYGVDPEYILGIMAVETTYGRNVGNHRVIDALTTLSFDYPRRAEFFKGELRNFLIMTRDEEMDPSKPVGSFAGAMGLGQFMPSSFLNWAVDFNQDGKKDLWNADDSVGSIAKYFAAHGWKLNQTVVSNLNGKPFDESSVTPGIESQYTATQLIQAGFKVLNPAPATEPYRLLLLRHQHQDEYLIGHPNFYVITRYNHSTHYAMAVHELAQAIKTRYKQTS